MRACRSPPRNECCCRRGCAARTFTLPKDVDDALAAYEAQLSEAIAHGGWFTRVGALHEDLALAPLVPLAETTDTSDVTLHLRVLPSNAPPSGFSLWAIPGETVAALKTRISLRAGPHESFFVLRCNGRPLKLAEIVDTFVAAGNVIFEVVWTTCSHSAPTHPITGESSCFWDAVAVKDAEY